MYTCTSTMIVNIIISNITCQLLLKATCCSEVLMNVLEKCLCKAAHEECTTHLDWGSPRIHALEESAEQRACACGRRGVPKLHWHKPLCQAGVASLPQDPHSHFLCTSNAECGAKDHQCLIQSPITST